MCEFFRQLNQWVSDLYCRLSLYSLFRKSLTFYVISIFQSLAFGMSKMNLHIATSTSNYFTTYCYNCDVAECE